jgi:NADP-dependent aldehyde dehydrogenase
MAAGGVQALLKGHRSVAGKRAVVAGTGPFLLPVAAGLADAGAEVVAICEAGSFTGWARTPLGAVAVPSKALEAVEYAATLARHRIPLRTRTAVTGISGDGHVESVTLGRLDRHGHLRRDRPSVDLAVDLVALGWGFTPSLELVTALGATTRLDVDSSLVAVVDAWQRTDIDGVYVAGEATGVGGAALALAEGELAGLAVVRAGGRPTSPRRARHLRGAIRRGRAFAAALHRAHPVPAGWKEWLRPDTTVCRCEEVTAGDVAAARDSLGAVDARTVKLLARPGMGWCQGRVCGFATACLATQDDRPLTAADLAPMAKRTLAAPVSLAELAQLD